jgi:hypothetical protein
LSLACLLLVPAACGTAADREAERARIEGEVEERVRVQLDRRWDRILARTDRLDDRLQPVPLLRPGEEAALRRFLNPAHLERARGLGARPGSTGALDSLLTTGVLVELEDSTTYWVVRRLEHSVPYVVPPVRALLRTVGERFQSRLDSLGLPPYRFEISSVLRTAEQQAALRATNANAAGGPSTHEYGTTVDIPYSAFAPPSEPVVASTPGDAPWLAGYTRRVADLMAERVAARRSRELQAVLGRVLEEMQSEGLLLVTLERLQPVYHLTLAKP